MAFLIGTFQIPPFLLPIYQAAGIQYDVPWQVLAAINWIETDYGRNQSVSPAGAVGWMQFMPSTWAQYGVDMTGNRVKDPYDPVDAIFAAARYLHAAGASTNLAAAIYAYNHAGWYVRSVLLRAKLISSYPVAFIDGLTGLMQARFPLAGHVLGYRHPSPVRAGERGGGLDREMVFAPAGTQAVAVADGTIVKIGRDRAHGGYVMLEDAYGNKYTYAQLGSVRAVYAVPKPTAIGPAAAARELAMPSTPGRPAAGSASRLDARPPGKRRSGPLRDSSPGASAVTQATPPTIAKERLFAFPQRRASYRAGGMQQ